MTATFQDVERWVREAERKKAAFLIVAVDRFDHENYPIYVMPGEDFWAKLPNGDNMQGFDEVYDMSMDLDDQLAERRAYHPPKREDDGGS